MGLGQFQNKTGNETIKNNTCHIKFTLSPYELSLPSGGGGAGQGALQTTVRDSISTFLSVEPQDPLSKTSGQLPAAFAAHRTRPFKTWSFPNPNLVCLNLTRP